VTNLQCFKAKRIILWLNNPSGNSTLYQKEWSVLDIYVGKKAKTIIEQQGLNQQAFSMFLGASGGPKWFTLFGLDKYIFGDFFKDRNQPLEMVGSSAGAFRIACFTQDDPVEAISKLAYQYSETDFTADVTPQDLTNMAEDMLQHVFTEQGISNIVNNPIFKANFIVAKANGCVAFENKLVQGFGLLKSFVLNKIDRKHLNIQYQRFVFRHQDSILEIKDPYQIDTQYVSLTEQNVKKSLLASGSIPLVMGGIKDIPGAPEGMYRDGGVIDYHFDISFNKGGLILYPHFNKDPKAGWFDKNLPRKVNADNYDRTVMLVPSDQFIYKLPYGKIPDRTDFETMDAKKRIKYWHTVFDETQKLADEFKRVVEQQDLSVLKPLPF